eukprot:2444026-Amphidinium_carterae.1
MQKHLKCPVESQRICEDCHDVGQPLPALKELARSNVDCLSSKKRRDNVDLLVCYSQDYENEHSTVRMYYDSTESPNRNLLGAVKFTLGEVTSYRSLRH